MTEAADLLLWPDTVNAFYADRACSFRMVASSCRSFMDGRAAPGRTRQSHCALAAVITQPRIRALLRGWEEIGAVADLQAIPRVIAARKPLPLMNAE